ncbi:MAG: hypothetical protein WCY58_04405 [Mariniphaga sp.]|nr:hypothetical protein [Mariniphaga sp.]MDD4225303.1 hypothetical protein [Mariniphaga sp.]
MWKKGLKLMGYLLLIAFMVVTLAFSSMESKNVSCRDIQIEFNNDESIKVSKDEIIRLVRTADQEIIGKDLRQINAELIEKEIEKHQAILNAEVYKVVTRDSSSYQGILGVRVSHREPVLRVMSSEGSYYLDESGEKVPLSTEYSARVIVASGFFSHDFARTDMLPFVLFVIHDPFWEAQLEQIHREQNGNILLTPLVGDHVIELGSLDNFQVKLRNLKAFYEQVMVQNNWDKYRQVSVKYNNQIIAKKR